MVEGRPPVQKFLARVSDRSPGIADLPAILEGCYRSTTGLGLGIVGTQRLMEHFHIETSAERGTTVLFGRRLPAGARAFTPADLARIGDELVRRQPEGPVAEVQRQNHEVLRAMEEVREMAEAQ